MRQNDSFITYFHQFLISVQFLSFNIPSFITKKLHKKEPQSFRRAFLWLRSFCHGFFSRNGLNFPVFYDRMICNLNSRGDFSKQQTGQKNHSVSFYALMSPVPVDLEFWRVLLRWTRDKCVWSPHWNGPAHRPASPDPGIAYKSIWRTNAEGYEGTLSSPPRLPVHTGISFLPRSVFCSGAVPSWSQTLAPL